MSGSHRRIAVCDRECAAANHCVIGGLRCEKCGDWFCAEELDENGVCDECAEFAVEDDGEEVEDECE